MPVAVGPVVISNRPNRLSPRTPFFKHYFVGGNSVMLKTLNAYREELGLAASRDALLRTMERTENQLQHDAAKLEIIDARLDSTTITAELRIANKTGHKFPTGFPSRCAWIHLDAADADGRLIYELGKPETVGRISGDAADVDGTTYEPHYQILVDPDDVQIYEIIMGDLDRRPTSTLLNAAVRVKDNRLLPAGFHKSAAQNDIAVRGIAANDVDFLSLGVAVPS